MTDNTMWTVDNRGHIKTGLTMQEVAEILLQDDGCEWEIRKAAPFDHRLWIRQEVANKAWTRTVIFSLERTSAGAERDIIQKVVSCGHWAHDNLSVWRDEDYTAMLAY